MIVKQDDPELIDHIGWDLWQATDAWKRRFTRAMVERGHAWYGEARGALIRHIDRKGVAQSVLTDRAGMTKQAVQQQLDELVNDGVVERKADPDDARRKLIGFTTRGRRALKDANEIKREIEQDYFRAIGTSDAAALRRALGAIIRDGDGSKA